MEKTMRFLMIFGAKMTSKDHLKSRNFGDISRPLPRRVQMGAPGRQNEAKMVPQREPKGAKMDPLSGPSTPQDAPETPQDASETPPDVPETPQDAPETPRHGSQTPQDAPDTPIP